LIKYWKI